ncbi:PAS domain S-box protein, partial [candidate division KSB1 bacterium]
MSDMEKIKRLEKEIRVCQKKLERSEQFRSDLERTLDKQSSIHLNLAKTKLELKKLSEVAVHGPANVFTTDKNGIIDYANDRFLKLTGYTKKEIIGSKPSILKSGKVPDKVYKKLWETILNGKLWKGELVNKKKNGDLYCVIVSISPVKNDAGEVVNFVAVSEDITELKEKERISKVFMDSADPIIIEDQDGKIIEMNAEAERSYGWSRKELIGKPIKKLVPKNKHSQADDLLERCRSGKEVRDIEGVRCTKEGKNIPVLLTLSLLKDENGNTIGVSSFAKDITIQKKAIENLRKVSQVFMDAADPIIIEDVEGNVVDMNIEAERAYGWMREELIGEPIKTLVPPELHNEADDILKKCRSGKEVRNIEGLRWTKEGKVIPVLLTLSLLKDVYGKVMGIASIAKDFTEQKRAEQKLLKYQKELEQQSHDLGERVKEMNCFYGVAELIENSENTLDDIFQGTAELLPLGWHYPEITCGRTIYKDKKYVTSNFKRTNWKLSAGIVADDKIVGSVDVFYLKKMPELDEGPFMNEECNLINGIAERLSQYIAGISAEKKIRDYQENLEKMVEEQTLELKSANETLQLTQNTVDNAGDAVLWLDPDTAKMLYVNKAACSSLGYTKEEMLKLHIQKLDPVTTKEIYLQIVEKLKSGEIITLESRHKKKNGHIFPVEITAQYIEYEGSGRIVAFVRDITERKQTESKLKESEKKANNILEFAPDGMVIIDNSAEIIKVNGQIEKMLGYDRDELIGQK